MDRRTFLGTVAGGLLAAPLAADGQQQPKTIPRLGMLFTGSPSVPPGPGQDAFMKQLGELGWVEGRNLAVERRWADRPDRLPDVAAELIRLNVSVILAPGLQAAQAAKKSTSTIPVVMVAFADPASVASLARPGGNITGLTVGQPEVVTAKRLELLKEAIPRLSRVAVLWDVGTGAVPGGAASMLEAAARSLRLQLQHLKVRAASDFEGAFNAAKKDDAGALLLMETPLMSGNGTLIAELGLKNWLPVMPLYAQMVEAGGLMSYGTSLPDLFRRAAIFVDKILSGANPADVPVEQPMKFELSINLKTAKALGLTIPPSLLQRADQVIE
jgi:ABC-type uncharacterized transport system substrate-binding protein